MNPTNGHHIPEAWLAVNLWTARRRSTEEAKEEADDTLYLERNVAVVARAQGIRDGLDLLQRIREAGSDPRALETIRSGL